MSEPEHVEWGWQVMRNGVLVTDPVERERCLAETFPYTWMEDGIKVHSMWPQDDPRNTRVGPGAIDKL